VDTTPNAAPERVNLTIPLPAAAEIYYDACAKIAQHNRCRQACLMLESNLKTKDWSVRLNMSILGVCIVDSWLLYSECRGSGVGQRQLYEDLAEELITNDYDSTCRGTRGSPLVPEQFEEGGMQHGPTGRISLHLTPTKKKRMKGTDET
jgi:hypothetical protein